MKSQQEEPLTDFQIPFVINAKHTTLLVDFSFCQTRFHTDFDLKTLL